MPVPARRRLLTAGLVAGLLGLARPALPQFTSFSSNPHNILEGNWQSCREDDGQYSERVFDQVVDGQPQYEVHLGPYDEFAIFKGVQATHRDHDSPANLLKPYRVPVRLGAIEQHWTIPSLNLRFDVRLAGGSRSACASWWITLSPLKPTSR
ncbi:MAG TPA: hypothetical protein VND92_11065 [Vicinamibacterales bacterium]|nr:hypothetical protein [Vicinamibacterales bacterium]